MSVDEAEARFREVRRCYLADRMLCSTVELARRYIADYPRGHSIVWLYLADSLTAMARYKEALAALRRALQLCPRDKRQLVYWRFGHLHRQRGAYRIAERWYRRAVEAAPGDATYHIFLGALLALGGRLEEAEAANRRATRCKIGCIAEVFLNLGLVLRAREHYPEARKCFQRALTLDPKCKQARRELADVERVLQLNRHA